MMADPDPTENVHLLSHTPGVLHRGMINLPFSGLPQMLDDESPRRDGSAHVRASLAFASIADQQLRDVCSGCDTVSSNTLRKPFKKFHFKNL